MTSLPDHYAALGIDPTADPEVITAAYRALAKKFHPDTGAAAGTASPERFDQIQKAYEVLREPENRRAYDLELLAAAEAELAAHLAAKRRIVPHGAGEAPPPPPPDLGDIRPEPATPPQVGPARKPAARSGRSALPFAVPLALFAGLGAAGAWVFLPQGPEAPPPPASAKVDAVVPAPATTGSATTDSAKTDANKTDAAGTDAVLAKAEPPAAATAPSPAATPDAPDAEKPLFGSTATTADDPVIEEAAASPEDDANAKPGVLTPPSEDAQAPPPLAVPQPDPPPVPKAKPAQAKPAPQKPAQQKPAQAKPPKQAPPPRARLTYNDPPQYDPGYDPRYDNGDYPPPGLEPPPGYAEPDDYPPPGYAPARGRYRLVIFERQPGRQATAWSAGVVFKSLGKCTRQGVKAVLRRTGDMDPYADTRVWYECQRLSQR